MMDLKLVVWYGTVMRVRNAGGFHYNLAVVKQTAQSQNLNTPTIFSGCTSSNKFLCRDEYTICLYQSV